MIKYSYFKLLFILPVLFFVSCDKNKKINIRLQSAYPKQIKHLGEQSYKFAKLVNELSGGQINIEVYEPGALVDTLELENAVQKRKIDAAFSGLGYTAEENHTLALFTSVPFGPTPMEYAAWMYQGGGLNLLEGYYKKQNFVLFPGILLPPEASGWYKHQITNINQFKGLKIRAYGLVRSIFEKLGAKTVMLGGAKLYEAMKDGSIDAVEYSCPSVDRDLNLYEVAGNYYFPGWHQPATFLFMYFNKDLWNSLNSQQQSILKTAATYLTFNSYVEIEHDQHEAIDELKKKTEVREWSKEELGVFKKAWAEVVEEFSLEDADFKKVLDSIEKYRADYRYWDSLNRELMQR